MVEYQISSLGNIPFKLQIHLWFILTSQKFSLVIHKFDKLIFYLADLHKRYLSELQEQQGQFF